MEVMSGSRRFLLLLVLASVTCVVLVQISMDGNHIARGFQYGETSQSKGIETSADMANLSTTQRKSAEPTVNKTTSTKPMPTQQIKTTKHDQTSTMALSNKTSIVVAEVQVRRLPLAKKVTQETPKEVLMNRQDRLREIIKQSNVIHRRATFDPMKSLKSIPIADPSKVTRIFILTYFRAGSSFFGDILQQNWKTFYHFEPLHSMTYDKRIDDEKLPDVFSLFDDILKCNFTEAKDYMKWVKKPRNQFLFAHNLFLWVTCHSNPKACFNPAFVNAVCMRSPIHVMKVTRLHMRQLRSYMDSNPDMKIKVVYLTRDPRGIVSSRWSLDWCNGTNCSDSGVLCREMDEDIEIFNDLQSQNPSRFIKVRYEDLAMNPETETEKLFDFLKLPFSTLVKKFLKTHTVSRKSDDINPYSTRRNSSSMVLSWRERFTYKQIIEVQSQCSNILNKLNHSLITSSNQLPYPNGRMKPKTLVEKNEPKVWRYNKNPLAKKYLAKNKEFNPYYSIINNQTDIFLGNNTNIEIHKTYKVVKAASIREISNTELITSLQPIQLLDSKNT